MPEKKIRIQFLDDNLVCQKDRLVSQYTEFLNGPKESWQQALRIEVTLENDKDIEEFTEYLLKIRKDIPKAPTTTRGRKPNSSNVKAPNTKDQRDELYKEAISKAKGNQDKLITFLREHNFHFITTEFAQSLKLPINFKESHIKEPYKYQWLMLCLREAKDPKNDKYDPMLVFGMNIMSRNEKVVVYKDCEYDSRLRLVVPDDTTFSFDKTKLTIFPEYMTLEEKERWRKEHRDLMDKPDKEPTKFYQRWAKFIQVASKNHIQKKDHEKLL